MVCMRVVMGQLLRCRWMSCFGFLAFKIVQACSQHSFSKAMDAQQLQHECKQKPTKPHDAFHFTYHHFYHFLLSSIVTLFPFVVGRESHAE